MLCNKTNLRLFFIVLASFTAMEAAFQAAAAMDTKIFDDYVVENSEYATSTGDHFHVSYIPSEDKVAVDIGSDSLIVANKGCSTGKIVEACFSGGRLKGYNYSLPGRQVYEYSIKLNLLVPDIRITKSTEKQAAEAGEEVLVSVNITNSGTSSGNVYFSESVPSGLKIVEIPDQQCKLSANNILTIDEDFKVAETKMCSYKVKSLLPGTYLLLSKAEFEAIKNETSAASASITVKNLPVSVNASLPGQILLGQAFNITLNLSANDKVESVFFTAFIPGSLNPKMLSKNTGATVTRQKGGLDISYGGQFTSLNWTAVDFKTAAEASLVGSYLISTKAEWLHNGLAQEISAEFPFNVTLAQPYLRIWKYDSLTGTLQGDIVNPSHLPVFNVSATFNGNETVTSAMINSLSYYSFDIAESRPGNATLVINYRTGYGQNLSSVSIATMSGLPEAVPKAESVNTSAPAPVPTPDISANSSNPSLTETQKEEPNKAAGKGTLKELDIKRASVIAGVIIAGLVVFFVVKAKKKSSENDLGI